MRVEICDLKPTKARTIHKVRIENKTDYQKVKWIFSRIPIKWAADDKTHTIHFLGKKY